MCGVLWWEVEEDGNWWFYVGYTIGASVGLISQSALFIGVFWAWCVDEVDVGLTRILAFLSVFYTPLKVCKIATFHKKTYSN